MQLIYVNFVQTSYSSFDVLNNLHDVLSNLDVSLFSRFILVGDFNVDFLSPNWPLYHKLLHVFCYSRLSPNPLILVTQVLRLSIINLVFASNPFHFL